MTGRTVVVADDEAHVVNTLSSLLEAAGYIVVGKARTGAEAVAMNRALEPDVLLLDLKMPGMDGLEAARRIMVDRPAPIVACSAYHDDELIAEASGAGVYAYVTKPCHQEAVVAALEVAISRFVEAEKLKGEIRSLSDALADRKWVDRAKHVIMQARGVSEGDAFRLLEQTSQRQGEPIVGLAKAIVSTESVLLGEAA